MEFSCTQLLTLGGEGFPRTSSTFPGCSLSPSMRIINLFSTGAIVAGWIITETATQVHRKENELPPIVEMFEHAKHTFCSNVVRLDFSPHHPPTTLTTPLQSSESSRFL